MYISIDRIVNGIAVCEREDLLTFEVPVAELPNEAKEGSVLIIDENGNYVIDNEEENRRRQRILDLQSRLFGDE